MTGSVEGETSKLGTLLPVDGGVLPVGEKLSGEPGAGFPEWHCHEMAEFVLRDSPASKVPGRQ